jgi:esterase
MDLFYKKYGTQGKPFLILHGVFGMLDNWHSLSLKLSETHTVYAIDLRNHGHSPHAPEMTYDIMARDVFNVMEKEGLSDCILLGHSMGGKVAMKFASLYPDKLHALIVADIAPKGYKPGHFEIIEALKALNFNTIRSRSDAQNQLAKNIHSEAIANFLLKNLHRNENGSYRLKMNLTAIENAYDQIISELEFQWPMSTATLFLKGANSNYILPSDQIEIERWFTSVKFAKVAGAGHWLHADNPTDFLNNVTYFLNNVPE